MPIPDPEHTIGIHDRGTGMTGARVRNAWRHRRNRLHDRSRERDLDRCRNSRAPKGVKDTRRLRCREGQIECRHRPLRHRCLTEPRTVRCALRFQQHVGVNSSRQTASDSTHQICTTNPDTRSITITGVVVLRPSDDVTLVVVGIAGADLADRQHGTTRARSPRCKCLNCSPPPNQRATAPTPGGGAKQRKAEPDATRAPHEDGAPREGTKTEAHCRPRTTETTGAGRRTLWLHRTTDGSCVQPCANGTFLIPR